MGIYDDNQSTEKQSVKRMRFGIDNVDNFIRAHGTPVELESAMFSPFRTKAGVPIIDAPDNGVGVLFSKPVETTLLLQAMERSFASKEAGDVTAGTAIATTERNDIITIRDRITVSDAEIPENILVYVSKKSVTHGIPLKFSIINVLDAIISNDDEDNKSVEPVTVEIRDNVFYPTTDMVGKFVSLRVMAKLRFYVVDILREARAQYEGDTKTLQENRERTRLPTKLLLKREDMFVPDILGVDTDDRKVTEEDDRTEEDLREYDDVKGFFVGGI